MKRYLVFCLGLIVIFSNYHFNYAVAAKAKMGTENYLELQADFYLPEIKSDAKAPVLFLAHNGGSNKEGWGDFPQQLAEQGWLVVNFNWNSNMIRTNLEAETIVQYTYKKYAAIADPERAAFIGGCRGGANLIAELTRLNKLPCKLKTVVVLSVSESSSYTDMISGLQTTHVPILAFYGLQDRLGEKYKTSTKKFADELLTQPKTVIALDAASHGDELAVDPSTKEQVRKEIISWLKNYLI